MILCRDGWGEYALPGDNADMSYAEIKLVREYHVIRNDLAKRHPGIKRVPMDAYMNLWRFS